MRYTVDESCDDMTSVATRKMSLLSITGVSLLTKDRL